MLEMDRFTSAAKWVLIRAHKEALKSYQEFIQPHHLLLSIAELSEIGGGIAYDMLIQTGISAHRIRDAISVAEEKGENLDGIAQVSPETEKVLKNAIEKAIKLRKQYSISPEHILLGILDTKEKTQEFLCQLDINPKEMSENIIKMIKED